MECEHRWFWDTEPAIKASKQRDKNWVARRLVVMWGADCDKCGERKIETLSFGTNREPK